MHFKKYGGLLPVLWYSILGYSRKNPISGIKGHETSTGIEETCGISGGIKKDHLEIPGVKEKRSGIQK